MNIKKKGVSNIILMVSITTLVASAIGLVSPTESGYVHAWQSSDNDKDEIENLHAGVGLTYYGYINQGIENPYEDGWD